MQIPLGERRVVQEPGKGVINDSRNVLCTQVLGRHQAETPLPLAQSPVKPPLESKGRRRECGDTQHSPAASLGAVGQQPGCKKSPLPAAMLRICLINFCLINTAFPHAAGCRDAQHHHHPARAARGDIALLPGFSQLTMPGWGAQHRSIPASASVSSRTAPLPVPRLVQRAGARPALGSERCEAADGQLSCGGD